MAGKGILIGRPGVLALRNNLAGRRRWFGDGIIDFFHLLN
jgi:hypothetical protein